MKKTTVFILVTGIFLLIIAPISTPARAQATPGLLIPIGGGYSDIYKGYIDTVVQYAADEQVNILVVPSAYSSNPDQITEAERQTNLRDAEERRFQIEEACKRSAPEAVTCSATLLPVFTQTDASTISISDYFPDTLTAVFILGGDQTVAMRAIINTPVERALNDASQRGVIIGGTSAGGGMISRTMLAGYNINYAAETSLKFGASDVWRTDEKHGLLFGLQTAILDQHFYQRARFGRLLNAILQPGVPHIGVGVDAYTGVVAENEILRDVFGLYTVTVLDAETYHAADTVKYIQAEQPVPNISARNILVHILSSGDFSFDLKTRIGQFGTSAYPPAPILSREFNSLTIPAGAGTLILAGDLSDFQNGNPILQRIVTADEQPAIAMIAAGYASERSANTALEIYAAQLPNIVAKIVVLQDDSSPVILPNDITAIVLIGKDQSKINISALVPVKEAWLSGTTVLADNAMSAVLGAFYSNHSPTPSDAEEAELATQKSFRQEKTNIQPGLGFVDITLEPQTLADNRFGRLFSLAYNNPELISVGLNKNSAIEFTSEDARVYGENDIFVLDMRTAKLSLGMDDGFVIINGLLDIFAPDEKIIPEPADINATYLPQPTPDISAFIATATPTTVQTPTIESTHHITQTETADVKQPASYLKQGMIITAIFGLSVLLFFFSRQRK